MSGLRKGTPPCSHHGAHIGSPSHTMEGQGKTGETYARRAQEFFAVRGPWRRQTATTRGRRQSPSWVVFADRSAHRFPESDAGGRVVYGQQGSDTGEPAGSHRGSRRRTSGSVSPRGRRSASPGRWERGRGSHYASSLLHFHDDKTG